MPRFLTLFAPNLQTATFISPKKTIRVATLNGFLVPVSIALDHHHRSSRPPEAPNTASPEHGWWSSEPSSFSCLDSPPAPLSIEGKHQGRANPLIAHRNSAGRFNSRTPAREIVQETCDRTLFNFGSVRYPTEPSGSKISISSIHQISPVPSGPVS